LLIIFVAFFVLELLSIKKKLMKQHFSSGNIPNNNEDYPNQKHHLGSEEEVQHQQQREDYWLQPKHRH
jgi:hypothetical protein